MINPQFPDFTFENSNSNILNILLPGKSGGRHSDLLNAIVNASIKNNHSVISFDYPFFTNNLNSTSKNLLEEQQALDSILKLTKSFHINKINFIAKSLGGIVLMSYLSNINLKLNFDVYILGFIVEENTLNLLKSACSINVWHGTEDEYVNLDQVAKILDQNKAIKTNLYPVLGANHGFNSPNTKDKKYHEQIISDLLSKLNN